MGNNVETIRAALRAFIAEDFHTGRRAAGRNALAALEEMQRDMLVVTKDERYYLPDGDLKWGYPVDVRHLILQLQALDPEMKVSSVHFIDTAEGVNWVPDACPISTNPALHNTRLTVGDLRRAASVLKGEA